MGQIQLKNGLDHISLALLAALLVLRFPFLMAGNLLLDSELVMSIYLDGTYLCSALLIAHQRQRLTLSNITAEAVWLFLAMPFASAAVNLTFYTWATGQGGHWSPVQMVTAAALGYYLWKTGDARLIRQEKHRFCVWMALTVAVAAGAAVLYDLPNSATPPVATARITTLGALCIYQMGTAALAEEPLFRGFMWGTLRQLGCTDLVICFIQGALFAVGHLYYLFSAPYSFWVLVPTAALLLGVIAWRSRSILFSMIAHAILNGLGEFLRFYV